MNKYLEMLDRITSQTVKEDVCFDSHYDEKTDTETFITLDINNRCTPNVIDPVFKGVVPDLHDVTCVVIDCETNEIDYITYFDEETEEKDPEWHDFEVRQLILDSLTEDELELYHDKCKAVIAKCIELWNEKRKDEHNRMVDRFGGEYI